MDLDIPTFEVDAAGTSLEKTGSYLLPAIRRGRVYLFIPQIILKTLPASTTEGVKMNEYAEKPLTDNNASKYWEVRVGWTELRNGQWSPKRISQAKLAVGPIPLPDTLVKSLAFPPVNTKATRLPSIDSFKFWIRSSTASRDAANGSSGVQNILNIDMEC